MVGPSAASWLVGLLVSPTLPVVDVGAAVMTSLSSASTSIKMGAAADELNEGSFAGNCVVSGELVGRGVGIGVVRGVGLRVGFRVGGGRKDNGGDVGAGVVCLGVGSGAGPAVGEGVGCGVRWGVG